MLDSAAGPALQSDTSVARADTSRVARGRASYEEKDAW